MTHSPCRNFLLPVPLLLIDSDINFIFSMFFLVNLIVADLCIALPSDTILARQDAICESAVAVTQDPNCWVALGYNTWFDTWKSPCPGAPGCTCDVSRPWSDCTLKQYHTALGSPAKSDISCTDLTRPDLCSIPSGDWTKLSENQLATAYVTSAIGSKLDPKKSTHIAGNLYRVERSLQFRAWMVPSHHIEPSTSSCLRNTL